MSLIQKLSQTKSIHLLKKRARNQKIKEDKNTKSFSFLSFSEFKCSSLITNLRILFILFLAIKAVNSNHQKYMILTEMRHH